MIYTTLLLLPKKNKTSNQPKHLKRCVLLKGIKKNTCGQDCGIFDQVMLSRVSQNHLKLTQQPPWAADHCKLYSHFFLSMLL